MDLIFISELAPVVPKGRQILPPLPGYIPVYIRSGNTPLEDINLDLAEAFQSYALKQGRLNSLQPFSQNILITDDGKYENDVNPISLEHNFKQIPNA